MLRSEMLAQCSACLHTQVVTVKLHNVKTESLRDFQLLLTFSPPHTWQISCVKWLQKLLETATSVSNVREEWAQGASDIKQRSCKHWLSSTPPPLEVS